MRKRKLKIGGLFTKEEVYERLKAKLLAYSDLKVFKPLNYRTNEEKFTVFSNAFSRVFVRESVAKKLENIDKRLNKKGLSLKLFCGYRSLKEQCSQFEKVCNNLRKKNLSQDKLFEQAHNFIAVPSVAGHPTGGAVDVGIVNNKSRKLLDFGTQYDEFDNKDIMTFSPFISKQAQKNREILRKHMLCEGFAPFDGEWWHFSYGDKEWAVYYKKDFVLFNQIEVSINDSFEKLF